MNIEPDIFDYLETTSLEPHDDYTSEITYKDQKIIWNRLKEKDKEIERLNIIINETKEEINQYKTLIETGVKGNCKKIYKQEALNILEMILLELKGDGREVMNKEVLNDLLYVLQQIDGYLNKNWTIDLNFTDIREKYKKDIEDYENWD